MPPIKLKAVISCSSEDPNNPAENLIKNDTTKKWKSNSWESSVSVLLEMEKATQITGIDIGNENSAFVEVLVGRSSDPKADFQVLLVASSFMSPLESRNCTNCNRVRMFVGDQLLKAAAEQKWDRFKVVCTQPFNKHIKFGLSFITLHAPASKNDSQHSVSKIGQFVVKESDDVIPVGSLFQKRKQRADVHALSGAAAIREASSPAALAKTASKLTDSNHRKTDVPLDKGKVGNETSGKTGSDSISNNKTNEDNKASTSRKTNGSEGKSQDDGKAKEAKGSKRESSLQMQQKAKKPRQEPEPAAKRRKPFWKLMEGVTFVISGYENPHRSNVRSYALEMGARYQPDWTPRSTHLICAFENTPKFRQVKGRGKIVTKEWIEECYQKHKRIPWRRFALEKKEKSKTESEEEILEEKQENVASKEDERLPSGSGSDTDDDIRRVQANNSHSKDGDKTTNSTNPYEDDTDVDSERDESKENHPDISSLPLPFLPSIFDGKTFYLSEDLSKDTRTRLNRYIIAFKGKIKESLSEEVQFVVANSRESIEKMEKYPNVTLVKSSWVWTCNDEGKLLPTSGYLL